MLRLHPTELDEFPGMENLQEQLIKHKEILQNQNCVGNELEEWSIHLSLKKNLPVKNIHKTKQHFETLKDCLCKPDNTINIPTSHLDDIGKNEEISSLQEKDVTVDNLMETVDLSDLTFSCNDFILDDCTCFEQASQLVDPMLKDSESTPFSFNNTDSVQLFRFSLTEISENNFTSLSNFSDNLFSKNSEKCEKTDKDHYSFYHVLELFDTNMNVEHNLKNVKDESLQYECNLSCNKKKEVKNVETTPIKKGRRYMPKFKEKVLEYTKNHTFKETALHFKINCNTITEWSRESKRLSSQHKKCSWSGSDSNNYKTDIVVTPETKTEIILLNDVTSFETDLNEPSLKNIENDLPSVDLKPDERFIKWVETKRLQQKQLSKHDVFFSAKCCMKKVLSSSEKPFWFVQWFERFNKTLKNIIKPNAKTEKYIKYPINFKLEVALYARIYGKNSAARVFNVSRKRIFDWFNCLNPLKDSFYMCGKNETSGYLNVAKGKEKFICKDKKDKLRSKIYSELHLWYQKRCLMGARPKSLEIKEKAREIFSFHGMKDLKFSEGWLQKFCQRMDIKLRHSEDDQLLLWVLTQLDNNVSLSHQQITEKSSSLIRCKKFKGSKGWTLRFLKRHRNLLQFSPTVQDPLPQIVEEKLSHFWDGFRQSLISFRLEPGSIGCMDEIPLRFNFPEEGKPSSLPLLRKTGFENCQGVVILCVLGTGRILPPAVVFKGSGPKQLLSDQNVDILILFQEKGLITVEVLEAWFNDIWSSCTPTPNALVVDSFLPHCSVEFKQLSARENCMLQVIPEGCSSRFQPLDVEVTPLFKEAIKKQWKDFSLGSSAKTSRSFRCPDQDTILRWVQNAYEKIKRNPVSIINSFKTTGLLQ